MNYRNVTDFPFQHRFMVLVVLFPLKNLVESNRKKWESFVID